MIFHENRLPADDSHETSCLICDFLKMRQNLKLSSAALFGLIGTAHKILFLTEKRPVKTCANACTYKVWKWMKETIASLEN